MEYIFPQTKDFPQYTTINNKENLHMDRHVSELRSLFTIKKIIRILSLICII